MQDLFTVCAAHAAVHHFKILRRNIHGVPADRGEPRYNAFSRGAFFIKVVFGKTEPRKLYKTIRVQNGGKRFADLLSRGEHARAPLPKQLNLIHITSEAVASNSFFIIPYFCLKCNILPLLIFSFPNKIIDPNGKIRCGFRKKEFIAPNGTKDLLF